MYHYHAVYPSSYKMMMQYCNSSQSTTENSLLQKLKNRKSVLDEAAGIYSWTPARKRHIQKLLVEDNMSSETSAAESDTDEHSFKVRRRKYIKKKFRNCFYDLDELYKKKLSPRSRSMLHPRVTSKHPYRRPPPPDLPAWATSRNSNSVTTLPDDDSHTNTTSD